MLWIYIYPRKLESSVTFPFSFGKPQHVAGLLGILTPRLSAQVPRQVSVLIIGCQLVYAYCSA